MVITRRSSELVFQRTKDERRLSPEALITKTVTMNANEIFQSDPEILAGTPAFCGTRVPIKSSFDHLEAGDSIDDFLEGFPSVRREQVIALLEMSQSPSS